MDGRAANQHLDLALVEEDTAYPINVRYRIIVLQGMTM